MPRCISMPSSAAGPVRAADWPNRMRSASTPSLRRAPATAPARQRGREPCQVPVRCHPRPCPCPDPPPALVAGPLGTKQQILTSAFVAAADFQRFINHHLDTVALLRLHAPRRAMVGGGVQASDRFGPKHPDRSRSTRMLDGVWPRALLTAMCAVRSPRSCLAGCVTPGTADDDGPARNSPRSKSFARLWPGGPASSRSREALPRCHRARDRCLPRIRGCPDRTSSRSPSMASPTS